VEMIAVAEESIASFRAAEGRLKSCIDDPPALLAGDNFFRECFEEIDPLFGVFRV